MHRAAALRAICLSDCRVFLLLHRCGLTVSSVAAFAGPSFLWETALTAQCPPPHWILAGFSLQSDLCTHMPDSTRTDQEGRSSGTDMTWCGTSVTPECDIALGVQKVRLVPAGYH